MTDDDRRLIGPKKTDQPAPTEMVAVLRWICPFCRESNPYNEAMHDQVVVCIHCGKLARPHQDLSDTPLLPAESAKAKRLLEW